ncbi:MAG: hypothetical protein E6Q33_03425 [Neisseriales bacterium]|nr:MAG: hypothetical protein E6Q33_03425 [Neisseriales bacterium]
MSRPTFSHLFITLSATLGLMACSSGTSSSNTTPSNNTAVLSILPSSAMTESIQYCQNNSGTDKPIFVNNISNDGLIVGGTYAPATSMNFPEMVCGYRAFTTNGISLSLESMNSSVTLEGGDQEAYGSQILSISNNNTLVGELQFNPNGYVAAISLNNQLQQIQPAIIPVPNVQADNAIAINSNGTLLVGSYNGTYSPQSYIYDTESSQYFTPALNVENIEASSLTSVSNNKIAVGGLKDTNGNFLGLICTTESCTTYTQDVNIDSTLVSISESSQYIIGYQNDGTTTTPFYLFRNNGHNSVLNLEPDFTPFEHSLTNDGITILAYNYPANLEEAYYFYNPGTHDYYNAVDFINSLNLGINTTDGDEFRISGISNNGKYLYGHIKQASSIQGLEAVTVPWRIYFPSGITSALESFQPANIKALSKNLKDKKNVKTTFMQ